MSSPVGELDKVLAQWHAQDYQEQQVRESQSQSQLHSQSIVAKKKKNKKWGPESPRVWPKKRFSFDGRNFFFMARPPLHHAAYEWCYVLHAVWCCVCVNESVELQAIAHVCVTRAWQCACECVVHSSLNRQVLCFVNFPPSFAHSPLVFPREFLCLPIVLTSFQPAIAIACVIDGRPTADICLYARRRGQKQTINTWRLAWQCRCCFSIFRPPPTWIHS